MSSEDELSHDEITDDDVEEEAAAAPVQKKRRTTKKGGKDPAKPKKNMSAYIIYCNANRPRIKEQNPDASFGDLAKLLSVEFKSLSAKERAKWDKKAAADKERYVNEMANYVPPSDDEEEGTGGGKKKKKAKKDPNAPKRNMSAYFLYSTTNRSYFKEQYPDASFGELAKIISHNYKQMNDYERSQWDKRAQDDKVRYQREMAAYQG